MAQLLGDMLVEAGLLSQENLAAALEYQRRTGRRLGEVLAEMGAVSALEVARVLSTQLDIPLLGPEQLTVDDAAVRLLPPRFCIDNAVAPVRRPDGSLCVAMADPLNVRLYDSVRETVGAYADRAVALEPDIKAALASRLSRAEAMDVLSKSLPSQATVEVLPTVREEYDYEEDEAVVDEAAGRIVNLIVGNALAVGAEEIVADPRPNGVLFRYRVGPRLRDALLLPSHSHTPVVRKLASLSGIEAPFAGPSQGHFRALFEDRAVDLVITMAPTARGVRAVMRLLPSAEPVPSLDEVGMPLAAQNLVYQALSVGGSVILVTGMLPGGRRSTMRACLSLVSLDACNVVAIEDTSTRGAFVGVARLDGGLDPEGFADTIRVAIQQDPDVLVVSQIRERGVAEMVLEAALDGRTVITSVSASNAVAALRKLLGLGVEPQLLATGLSLLLCHRSLRRVCQQCKDEASPSGMVLAELSRIMGREIAGPFWEGKGCEACAYTGFDGTISVYGALRVDTRVRVAIIRGLAGQELGAALVQAAFVSPDTAALEQALAGLTTAEELLLQVHASV